MIYAEIMKLPVISFLLILNCMAVLGKNKAAIQTYPANDQRIQYVGRIDFRNPTKPRFWSPGVYITARFKGTSCEVMLNDQELYGTTHNYIEIAIDDQKPFRVQTTGKENVIKAAENLSEGEHTITICKDTEASIGYLEFTGIRCERLLTPTKAPVRKIEYIGDSITCGSAMDLSVPCGTGQWYDQNNAYMSYGTATARNLGAQYHLSSVSGIGLIHSCCDMKITMPQVFDKTDMRADSLQWDFNRYQPDVVTVCLGQNDGVQDSTAFCSAYVNFIKVLRGHYPKAEIVCLSSPMADAALLPVLKKYIIAVNSYINKSGDKKVNHYFFSKRYTSGCGTHPDMAEHQLLATELTDYIRQLKHW